MPDHWMRLQNAQTISTRHFLDTQAVLDDAAECGGIVTILGETGLGKTHASRYWLEGATLPTVRVQPSDQSTPRQLIADLYQQVIKSETPPAGTQFTLQNRLCDEIEGQPWLWIIDEAQWLTRTLKTLRGLWLDERVRIALAFVGGPEFETLLDKEPMLRHRLVQTVKFQPLAESDVLEAIPHFHPIWTDAEERVLTHVNRTYANGRFRLWANFTRLAVKRCREFGEATVTYETATALLRTL